MAVLTWNSPEEKEKCAELFTYLYDGLDGAGLGDDDITSIVDDLFDMVIG